MSLLSREYYYNEQLKNYLLQFMAIFAGMKVQVGWNEDKEPRVISIPVISASRDRVAGAIKGDNTQNKPIRLPTMSAWINTISMSPELRKGIPTVRKKTYMPTGGLFPDDIRVVEQKMPVPYRISFELGVWASNQDQHFQIIEQIMMLFNPLINLQTSDELFDSTKITTVELTGIQLNENVPAGTERRLIQSTLTFEAPIWISAPTEVHNRYIRDIYIRVGAVQTASVNSRDIIADLDAQGIPYDLFFTLDDVNIEDVIPDNP